MHIYVSDQIRSVAQLCPTLCNPMNRSTPGLYAGFPSGSDSKESACSAGHLDSIPGSGPWRRKWQPTPVFLPEKFYGQRSLAGYNPWGG